MELTYEQLQNIYPGSTEENRLKYYPHLHCFLIQYKIDTPERLAAFLAQIGHESGQLRYVEEIASGAAYEGRKDLGNVKKGDGKNYKGRGLIQITGRSNYKQISDAWGIDFISCPNLLKEPEFAVRSACWWWDSRGLNKYATLNEADFRKITRIINGGYNGYADRKRLWERAKAVLIKTG